MVNVTGGKNLSMFEAQEASSVIRDAANTNVDITFGMALDEKLGDEVRVTVIATGIDKDKQQTARPRRAVNNDNEKPAPLQSAAPASTATSQPSQDADQSQDPFSGWNDPGAGEDDNNRRQQNFDDVKKPDFSVQDDDLGNVDDGGEDLSTPAFFKNRRK